MTPLQKLNKYKEHLRSLREWKRTHIPGSDPTKNKTEHSPSWFGLNTIPEQAVAAAVRDEILGKDK